MFLHVASYVVPIKKAIGIDTKSKETRNKILAQENTKDSGTR